MTDKLTPVQNAVIKRIMKVLLTAHGCWHTDYQSDVDNPGVEYTELYMRVSGCDYIDDFTPEDFRRYAKEILDILPPILVEAPENVLVPRR